MKKLINGVALVGVLMLTSCGGNTADKIVEQETTVMSTTIIEDESSVDVNTQKETEIELETETKTETENVTTELLDETAVNDTLDATTKVESSTTVATDDNSSIPLDTEMNKVLTTYTEVLTKLLNDGTGLYTVSDMETPATLMSTDVGFIDINSDNIPELIVGCGHGINGIDEQQLYRADGTCIGNYAVNYGGIVAVNNTCYAIAQSNGYVLYTKLCDEMPCVYLDWRTDDGYEAVHVKTVDIEEQELGAMSFDEAAETVQKYLGVTEAELSATQGTAKPRYVCDTLRVADPQNYTDEDIYNSLLTLYILYETKE